MLQQIDWGLVCFDHCMPSDRARYMIEATIVQYIQSILHEERSLAPTFSMLKLTAAQMRWFGLPALHLPCG